MGTGARVSQVAAGALIAVAAAVAATWPLALRPAHAIVGGLGDPILNTTILAWDADRIAHAFRGLWDAPFLFPHRHTLAYSEHLLGIAWFTTPVIWIARNAVFAYNVAYIGSYALSGFGMFLLVRSLTGRADAAILAGLAFELTPYRLAQSTHLQVLMNGWMPIGLWALHRYFETRERRWIAAFAAAYALLGLSNGYYFYFFAVPALLVALVGLAGLRTNRSRAIFDLAAAASALVAIVAPIALVYYRLQQAHGFARTEEDLSGLSARLGDYLHTAAGAWTWRGLLPVGAAERELFHGFVAIGFAALGVVAVRSRAVLTYAAITTAAIWLSLGTNGGPLYGWLFQHVPGFNGLRVPARFSSVAVLGLSVLAGIGFAWVLARLPRASGAAWAAAIAGIILLEGQHGVTLTRVPDTDKWDRVAYDWLRAAPLGAALELNMSRQNDFHAFTTRYQLEAVRHRHPIVNGYSGWKSELQEWLAGPDSPLNDPRQVADAIRGLRDIGVRYVLLHDATFPTAREAAAMADRVRALPDQIVEEHRFGGTWAWRLADASAHPVRLQSTQIDSKTLTADASQQRGRAELLVDGDPDTRWLSGEPQNGGEWIELRLPTPTDVARIDIVTAARSLSDYPRRLVVESDGRTVFEGSIVSHLIEALAVDDQYPRVTIELPRNATTRLRIRQTAQSDRWWSVHELVLFRRR